MPTYSATNGSCTTDTIWPIWANGTSNTITTTAATSVVWRQWITTSNGNVDSTGIPDATTSTAQVWGQWVTATAGTTGNVLVWNNWNDATTQSIRPQGAPIRGFTETPEMVAERERRAAEHRRLQEEETRKRALAEERATQLLVSMLSEEQKRDFAAHGHFFVDALVSGRRYRIDKGRSGNIKVIDRVTGVWTESLCIHQRDYVPVPDTMLMQKLLIETAEDELRRVANITRRDGGFGYGQGVLDGPRLAQVIPFAPRERVAA